MADRFPLDYDQLHKGSIISIETIEEYCGYEHGTDYYNLSALRLKNLILQAFEDRGDPVTMKSSKGQLIVLTDQEASNYNDKRQRSGMKTIVTSYKRLVNVDAAALEDGDKKTLERRLIISGKVLQGMIAGHKEGVKLVAEQRKTPLPPPTQQPSGQQDEQRAPASA